MQTDGESDKMRISHVIKTDQWRSDRQIRSAPHFVVSGDSERREVRGQISWQIFVWLDLE